MIIDLNSPEMILESWKAGTETVTTAARYAFCQIYLQVHTVITFEDTKEMWKFKKETGLYEPAETIIETEIQETFKEEAKKYHVNEILGTIQRLSYRPRAIIASLNYIPLENGYYDLETSEFKGYTPETVFFSKHPIYYNPIMDCPKIKEFLSQVTENDASKQEILMGIAAYCFYRYYSIQKAIMLVGSGANGKSVYLNLVRALLGNSNVTSLTLQGLTENQFSSGKLYGKNANIFADLESRALKTTGIFKALTGGDYLTCDRKFKEPFDFLNYAKLLFSCNQMPATNDESDAFFRRWVIVEFTRIFTQEEQNPRLIEELTNPNELSGFFNLLIPQLHKILDEKRIDNETVENLRKRYERNSDSAKAFFYDCLEFSPEEFVVKTEIFSTYLAYCRAQKLLPKQENPFFKKLFFFYEGKAYQSQMTEFGGIKVRIIRGLTIKKEEKEEK